jgi:hypothetical protein
VRGLRLRVFEGGVDGVAMSDGFFLDSFVFFGGGEWYITYNKFKFSRGRMKLNMDYFYMIVIFLFMIHRSLSYTWLSPFIIT